MSSHSHIMRSRHRNIFRVQTALMCVYMVSIFGTAGMGYAQEAVGNININSFFNSNLEYSAYGIQEDFITSQEGFRPFRFGDWRYRNIYRSPNTKNFFSQVSLDNIISSNRIDFDMFNEGNSSAVLRGAEISLKNPVRISQLGYALYTRNEDVTSKYFLVGFLTNSRGGRALEKPSWRMLAYVDEENNLVAEITSIDGIYFVSSDYEYLQENKEGFSTSTIPSLFILEKQNQSIISVFNNLSRKVVWSVDNVSNSDQTAIAFYVGMLYSMRFEIANSGRLYTEKKQRERERERVENLYLIDKETIIAPEDIN